MISGTQVAEPAQAADLWRFFSFVEQRPNGCWQWLGSCMNKGYGQWHGPDQRTRMAHVWIMEVLHGPLPLGLVHDHLCRNRGCVNPAHLERVTPAINSRRGVDARPRCRKGHLYSPENTSIEVSRGRRSRRCKQCRNDAQRLRWVNRKKNR